MCGRFNIISDPLTRFLLEITGQRLSLKDQYNIAPSEDIPVLMTDESADLQLRKMRWWLVPGWSPAPSSKYAMFNARSENLEKSRAFREPFRSRRCIIPASGYYEWKREGDNKIPLYITPINEDSHLSAERHSTGFLFAGLWDIWEKEGRVIESCTLITTAATQSMSKIHGRMPVMLNKNEAHTWIDKASDRITLRGILNARLKIQLEATPVSDWVNNARHKDSRCVIPAGESLAIHN